MADEFGAQLRRLLVLVCVAAGAVLLDVRGASARCVNSPEHGSESSKPS